MLKPALALVSMKITPRSRDFESPSSIDTCLRYEKRIRPLSMWLVTWMDQHMPVCMEFGHGTKSAPFVDEICFVAHQHNDHIAAALVAYLLNPPQRVQERLPICSRCPGGVKHCCCENCKAVHAACTCMTSSMYADATASSLVTSYTTTATEESRM
jgi:hypothetical protein